MASAVGFVDHDVYTLVIVEAMARGRAAAF
jgi:hypothetical protein